MKTRYELGYRCYTLHISHTSKLPKKRITVAPTPNRIRVLSLQQERAYQRQPTVFQNRKKAPGVKRVTLRRYTRAVGLGFKAPAEVMWLGSTCNPPWDQGE